MIFATVTVALTVTALAALPQPRCSALSKEGSRCITLWPRTCSGPLGFAARARFWATGSSGTAADAAAAAAAASADGFGGDRPGRIIVLHDPEVERGGMSECASLRSYLKADCMRACQCVAIEECTGVCLEGGVCRG